MEQTIQSCDILGFFRRKVPSRSSLHRQLVCHTQSGTHRHTFASRFTFKIKKIHFNLKKNRMNTKIVTWPCVPFSPGFLSEGRHTQTRSVLADTWHFGGFSQCDCSQRAPATRLTRSTKCRVTQYCFHYSVKFEIFMVTLTSLSSMFFSQECKVWKLHGKVSHRPPFTDSHNQWTIVFHGK